jgi:hypothetical protein
MRQKFNFPSVENTGTKRTKTVYMMGLVSGIGQFFGPPLYDICTLFLPQTYN